MGICGIIGVGLTVLLISRLVLIAFGVRACSKIGDPVVGGTGEGCRIILGWGWGTGIDSGDAETGECGGLAGATTLTALT